MFKINFFKKFLCKLYCDISHTSVFVRIHTQRQRMQFRDHIVINLKTNVKNSSWFTNWNELGHGSTNSMLSMFAIEIFGSVTNTKMDQLWEVRRVHIGPTVRSRFQHSQCSKARSPLWWILQIGLKCMFKLENVLVLKTQSGRFLSINLKMTDEQRFFEFLLNHLKSWLVENYRSLL